MCVMPLYLGPLTLATLATLEAFKAKIEEEAANSCPLNFLHWPIIEKLHSHHAQRETAM